jgi:hypothetical protein
VLIVKGTYSIGSKRFVSYGFSPAGLGVIRGWLVLFGILVVAHALWDANVGKFLPWLALAFVLIWLRGLYELREVVSAYFSKRPVLTVKHGGRRFFLLPAMRRRK